MAFNPFGPNPHPFGNVGNGPFLPNPQLQPVGGPFQGNPIQARSLAATLANNGNAPGPGQATISQPTEGTGYTTNDPDDDDNEDSNIVLRISAPLKITGDGNLITVDPSQAAARISLGVVQAVRQISLSDSGIPMVDHEGRPRPLKVVVKAETEIKGSKNLVGEKAVMEFVTSSAMKGNQVMLFEEGKGEELGEGRGGNTRKGEGKRSGSEPPEAAATSKRARVE